MTRDHVTSHDMRTRPGDARRLTGADQRSKLAPRHMPMAMNVGMTRTTRGQVSGAPCPWWRPVVRVLQEGATLWLT
jgi:hypothetical protein